MSHASGMGEDLISSLQHTFWSLSQNPYPTIVGPESLKKRASVALIVRVQPRHSHWPATDAPVARDLDTFFVQDWVKHGDPEVLFIKRAARKGDRWTSHVALPGGRRDPEDADDQAAAIREASEEVGVNLTEDNCIAVGNLPQRVVTTSWGKVPLMVLCPYVFLITKHFIPPLKLQPTEVASAHWVPLRALLSAENRTVSFEDVSNRIAHQETGVKRWLLRAMLGKMMFAAIRLCPSESLHCNESIDGPPEPGLNEFYAPRSLLSTLFSRKEPNKAQHEQRLLLWGLTLGVMADFLDLFPPHTALQLWTYPTFTPWDVRFAVWAMSYRFKQQKMQEIATGHSNGPTAAAVEAGLDAVSVPKDADLKELGMGGLGSGVDHRRDSNTPGRLAFKSSAVATMLEGYYDIVRKAVAVALVGRTSAFVALAALLWVRYRRRFT